MKTEFLKKLGIDEGVIAHIMAENGRDIQREKERTQAAADSLEEAQAKIAALQERISAFDGDKAAIETLTAENGALKETIAKRDAEEAHKQQIDALRSQFDDASQGRKFLNSYTEAAIFEQFKAAMNEGEREAKAVFEAITGGVEGIFQSQNPPAEIPGVNPGLEVQFDEFRSMGYAERVRLFNDDPALYRELKNLSQISN